ncbi:PREDICTED: venom serine protease 34-like [Eufriesea mexicana]|uniref:venom serine protease 34-like n=1 Tax=Eufriesea mexicana TaxID=516756 RepID=UPI00083BFEE8|nr:PREDICTED: venom serine protease 34-like [Eufriesea mexicana]
MVSVNNDSVLYGVITKAALLSFLVLLSLAQSNETRFQQNCDYYQELAPDTTYFIYNPEYPNRYRGFRSCKWTIETNYRVNLTCNPFHIPWSQNCTQDRLSVQVNSRTTHQYCGDGVFNVLSESNKMVVTLKSPFWSKGGEFICAAQAVNSRQESENCECGRKNPTRIVGGVDAGVNEFPMMAGIVDVVLRRVFCGSTLIAKKYVVTAAHCLLNKEVSILGILLGEHDVSTGMETNATALYRVVQAISHPNYIQGTPGNDIALLKSETDMIYSNEVGPACLPFQHAADSFGGSEVQILGWGSTDFGSPTSDVLQKVTLYVLTNLQCSKRIANISPQEICTYGEGKDACQMDSGGPVLWENPMTKRLTLIGIVSRGIGCAVDSGINTKVGSYIDWITSVTLDETYCIVE